VEGRKNDFECRGLGSISHGIFDYASISTLRKTSKLAPICEARNPIKNIKLMRFPKLEEVPPISHDEVGTFLLNVFEDIQSLEDRSYSPSMQP
jgi:hypothetical protein